MQISKRRSQIADPKLQITKRRSQMQISNSKLRIEKWKILNCKPQPEIDDCEVPQSPDRWL